MQIIPLKEIHLHNVIRLSDNAFGKNYSTLTSLSKYHSSDNHIGLVCIKDECLMGFLIMDIITPKELLELVLNDKNYFLSLCLTVNSIGFIKQVVVQPKYQRKRIAQNLLKEVLKNTPKIDLYISTAWVKKGVTPIKKLF